MQRLFSLKFEALIIQILLPTCLYTDDLALPVGCLPLIPPHHSQLCILNQKSKQIACLGKRHFFPPSPKEFCLPGFLERLQCLIQSSTDIICCVLSQPPPPIDCMLIQVFISHAVSLLQYPQFTMANLDTVLVVGQKAIGKHALFHKDNPDVSLFIDIRV